MTKFKKLSVLRTLFLFIACSIIRLHCYALEGEAGPVSSELSGSYAKIEFASPDEVEDLGYLGLAADNPAFSISEIKADIIIIEIVTAYCPHCGGKTSSLNEVYNLIETSSYSDRIKIIGIGMSNSERELELFKEKYNIPFPLFADPENKMYAVLGRINLPHWVVLKSDHNGGIKEVYSLSQELPEPKSFLDLVLEKTY